MQRHAALSESAYASERNELREVVVAHHPAFAPVSMVRSMLLQSSIATLQGKGLFERYLACLEPAYHEPLLQSLGPGWSEIALACAHYRACDAMRLGQSDLFEIGQAVGKRLEGTFLVTAGKTLRGVGVTPWHVLGPLHRMGSRIFHGGSVQMVKVGPKDLVVELRQAVLSQFEYFRIAYCGAAQAAFTVIGARSIFSRILSWDAAADRFSLRISWV